MVHNNHISFNIVVLIESYISSLEQRRVHSSSSAIVTNKYTVFRNIIYNVLVWLVSLYICVVLGLNKIVPTFLYDINHNIIQLTLLATESHCKHPFIQKHLRIIYNVQCQRQTKNYFKSADIGPTIIQLSIEVWQMFREMVIGNTLLWHEWVS